MTDLLESRTLFHFSSVFACSIGHGVWLITRTNHVTTLLQKIEDPVIIAYAIVLARLAKLGVTLNTGPEF